MSFDAMGNPVDGDIVDENAGQGAASIIPDVLTVDYYRQKVIDFQNVLNELDKTYFDLIDVGTYSYASGDQNSIDEYEQLKASFENKRGSFRTTAEALQLASQGINSLGVNFPSITIPSGLAIVPLVPLVAVAAAVTVAISLMTWAKEFWNAVSNYASRHQQLEFISKLPQEQQANALAKLQQTELAAVKALAVSNESPISSIASLGKWILLFVAGFAAYKLLEKHRGHR